MIRQMRSRTQLVHLSGGAGTDREVCPCANDLCPQRTAWVTALPPRRAEELRRFRSSARLQDRWESVRRPSFTVRHRAKGAGDADRASSGCLRRDVS
jgi:hypothetical protein